MKYKLLGNSGLRVSEFALGGMTIGSAWDWGTNKAESFQILNEFSENGGNYIDTSCNYQDGESEKIIGEYVKEDRDRYVIATKFSLYSYKQLRNPQKDDPNRGGNARKNMRRSVEESLERLNTDFIDILYLHMWDYTTPIKEILLGMNDLIRAGKVNYLGISDTPAWIVSKANTMADYLGLDGFVTFQFPYSIDFRFAESEVIPLCREQDMAMAAFHLLQEGLYTGKYTRSQDGKGRIRPDTWESDRGKNVLKLAREVDQIADNLGVPTSHVAISWVLGKAGVFTPILGVSSVAQLKENLGSIELNLKNEDEKRLDQLASKYMGFSPLFPTIWLSNSTKYLFGDTYDRLENHRLENLPK